MKIATIFGTRPEIIRLSRIIPLLDRHADHVVIHTGQNYDSRLSDIFFSELKVRRPNYILDCQSKTPFEQIGTILKNSERILKKEHPDRVLILGDTNSGLSAVVAKKLGIIVFHMEAGNRCYDDRVPEEVNRRTIDHSSDFLLPYTERSRANLLREGIPGERIYVTGNPIFEVLEHYEKRIENSQILRRLKLRPKKYFLVTLHRAENVDEPYRLKNYLRAFQSLAAVFHYPIIFSVHPRTQSHLSKQHASLGTGIVSREPFGLFDFVHLEQHAFCVLSDSGTVQEECSIFRVPNVTLRDVTERPETVEVGSNIIAGCDPDTILRAVKLTTELTPSWNAPPEYTVKHVSETIAKIILGHAHLGVRPS